MEQFEIAVVGGGMVGAAMALGLAKQGRSVAVIEKFPLKLSKARSQWTCVFLLFLIALLIY